MLPTRALWPRRQDVGSAFAAASQQARTHLAREVDQSPQCAARRPRSLTPPQHVDKFAKSKLYNTFAFHKAPKRKPEVSSVFSEAPSSSRGEQKQRNPFLRVTSLTDFLGFLGV